MGQLKWELIVADNASTDDTLEVVHELAPFASVISTGRNGGYAAGINAAVRAAAVFDAILVLNPDVRLTPGCAAILLAALKHYRAGWAVPRLADARGELIHSIRRRPTLLRAWGEAVLGAQRAGRYPALGEMETRPGAYANDGEIDWAEGSTVMISSDCWSTCGEWDESFFLYSEETEYALRARDRGYRGVFVSTADAVHLEGGSGSPPLWSMLVVNKVRLFSRHHGALEAFGFWAAQLWREGTRAALGRKTSRAAVVALCTRAKIQRPPGPHWL
jgi:GT2 family glycosyltransferase